MERDLGKEYRFCYYPLPFEILESSQAYAKHLRRSSQILEAVLQLCPGSRIGTTLHGNHKGLDARVITKTAIVIPDQHFPIHDQKAVNCALEIIKIAKPDIFINLGDVGEWETVSAWRWRDKKQPPLEYQLPLIDEEIEAVNDGIDQFDQVLDKVGVEERHILEGNHDYWLNNFVNKYPYLKGYKFKNACHWDKRGYKFHSMNRPLRIGKLSFIHGAYVTMNHAKKHAEIYGNLVYGHTHDVTSSAIGRLDGTVKAWSMGNLKDMTAEKNEWLKGRIHNWQHAVGHITWFKNGNFKVEVIDIVKGVTAFRGEEING